MHINITENLSLEPLDLDRKKPHITVCVIQCGITICLGVFPSLALAEAFCKAILDDEEVLASYIEESWEILISLTLAVIVIRDNMQRENSRTKTAIDSAKKRINRFIMRESRIIHKLLAARRKQTKINHADREEP